MFDCQRCCSVEVYINVNTNMYIFAWIRMYKITRFLALNDSLIDKNLLQWKRLSHDVKHGLILHLKIGYLCKKLFKLFTTIA